MNDELQAIANRWRVWAMCLHEAAHCVAAVARGRKCAGAVIVRMGAAYSRCNNWDPVVLAAGDVAVQLRGEFGTQPPAGDYKFHTPEVMPQVPLSDSEGVARYIDLAEPERTPYAARRAIEAEAAELLRPRWLVVVDVATRLYQHGTIDAGELLRLNGQLELGNDNKQPEPIAGNQEADNG